MLKKLLITALLLLNFSVMAENITLTPDNHVLLRGTVDGELVTELNQKLLRMSFLLPEDATIYMVIDSGGGSVYDGIDLINVMNIIPQKIVTVSMFAFSMAYSISQRGDRRLIGTNGIMGQHRAKGSFSGQFGDGEVEKRLALWKSIIRGLNQYEADKMGITLEEFQKEIKDEMYVYDTNAVDKKVADGVAKLSCSKELVEQLVVKTVKTMFGNYVVTYSGCPVIRNPLNVQRAE